MIQALFDKMAEAMPDFKSRPQQLEMSDFIASRLMQTAHNRVAVVEAPTGVGKTLAYLAGSIHQALDSNKVLVISTATVNLQQQLLQKDLPYFKQATDLPLRFVEAKGRRRYLCPSKLSRVKEGEQQQDWLESDSAKQDGAARKQQAQQLFDEWQQERWDGDKDSYPENIRADLWQHISTDSEGCVGKNCSFYLNCPYYKVRKALLAANVIVANHDLVLSDADLGGGLVLPNPEEVIFVFDEAHNLPQKALDHAAKLLNFSQLYHMLETADNALKRIPKALAFRQHDFGYMLSELRRDLPALMTTLQQIETVLHSTEIVQKMINESISEQRIYWGSPLVEALLLPSQNGLQRAGVIYKHFKVFAQWIKTGLESKELSQSVAESLLPQVGLVQNTSGYLIDFMMLFLDEDKPDHPPNVRWLSYQNKAKTPQLSIHAGPMTAAFFLEKSLWNRAHGAVLTSATLRGMGLFQRFRYDCGLHRFSASHFLAVKSPFDYSGQASLNLPEMDHLPNQDLLKWRTEVAQKLRQLIDKREATLVLFTAKQTMDFVYQVLADDWGALILLQGDKRSPKQIVSEHIKRVEQGQGSIIFGMDRFAEGVDLPGELCSHVIITKLPFPVFTRPIEQAKQEWVLKKGGQPFVSLSLPAVSMRLIQACGRLLRKETDSGRITILDRRLLTKAYGKQLLEHLPDYRLHSDQSIQIENSQA